MPQTDSTMPPIPLGLQEMLKDYPQHLERLQEVLNSVAAQPYAGIPHFERAIWALEARLETFIAEARQELVIAEESGDEEKITSVKKTKFIMLDAGAVSQFDLSALKSFMDSTPQAGDGHER